MAAPTTAIIIGAGPAGIAMGYHLKKKLGTNDFAIFDQNSGAGGTWYSNSYPGCGMNIRTV
jgi:cation diffusion facilitator CzcD-associated flavoprotein CzcO